MLTTLHVLRLMDHMTPLGHHDTLGAHSRAPQCEGKSLENKQQR